MRVGRPRLKELSAPYRPAYSHHDKLPCGAVILESGLSTRPFTLFSSLTLCTCPHYATWTINGFIMNRPQDRKKYVWSFLSGYEIRCLVRRAGSFCRRMVLRLVRIFSNQHGGWCQNPTPILPQAKFRVQKRATYSRNPLICMVPAPGIEPGTY